MPDNEIILVHGDKSKWYEQAIFILKRGTPKPPATKDFVSEAEHIVQAYLRGESRYSPVAETLPMAVPQPSARVSAKRRKHTNFVINAIFLLSCAALMVVLATQLLG